MSSILFDLLFLSEVNVGDNFARGVFSRLDDMFGEEFVNFPRNYNLLRNTSLIKGNVV